MNTLKLARAGQSRRPARVQEQFVVVLATVGLTAAISLAAVGPDSMRAESPAAAEAAKAPAPVDTATPRFERSNEPAIEVELVIPYGG